MIRIAFVIDSIVEPIGGTERQLLLLIEHLNRQRFAPELYCLTMSDWLERNFNLCPLHIVGIDSFRHRSSARHILKFAGLLRRNGVDVVQTFFQDGNVAGVIAARLAGIRAIVSSRRGVALWRGALSLRLLRLLNRLVPVFIANCQATRQWVADTERVPLERIHVIYNALDAEPFKSITPETRRRYREELDIPADAPVIGIVANLRPVKRLDVFIRAAQLVRAHVRDACFIVIGEGIERDRLESLAGDLGLKECLKFLGTRLDVVPLLSAFDIGVLSSGFESFPNAIVEYLAAGLPVVCTDVGGCREVVHDGKNGFVVPVGDARRMADAIVQVVNCGFTHPHPQVDWSLIEGDFSLAASVERHESVYLDLVKKVR
jgi:glycosyltransferase involved in cell wall biosynthesis